MVVFVRAVELEGFSAAAGDLALTPSAVSKIVTRLERRLGVRLLNRTTRKLALTVEGAPYFAHCQRILAEMEKAESEVLRHSDRPSGLLRMNCGLTFGHHQLVPVIPEFLRRYPGIQLELELTGRIVNLMEEDADLAVRIGAFSDSSLIARKICDMERLICASPEYLKRHGEPRDPEDLLKHNCLYITEMPTLRRWPFKTSRGLVNIEVTGNVAINSADALLSLALQGVGIIRVLDYGLEELIKDGRLVPLLVDTHEVVPTPLHALYPQNRYRMPKLSAMIDYLMEKFSHAPWRTIQGRR